MKKRIVSMSVTILLLLGILLTTSIDTRASQNIPLVDGSFLTYDDQSIGYALQLTRGIDLLNGYSKIVRLGVGSIYAGGTTVAAHTVAKVKLAVIVERIEQEGDSWEFYATWAKENLNADRASANRQLSVDGGYYYRVRCIHSANSDVSSSFTNGIYIQ